MLPPTARRSRSPKVPGWGSRDVSAGRAEGRVDGVGELGIPVPDQEPDPSSGTVQVHQDGAGLLGQPVPGRVRGHCDDPDSPGRVVDEEEDVQPAQGDGLDVERSQAMRPQELLQVGPDRCGAGVQALRLEQRPDRRGTDPIPTCRAAFLSQTNGPVAAAILPTSWCSSSWCGCSWSDHQLVNRVTNRVDVDPGSCSASPRVSPGHLQDPAATSALGKWPDCRRG